MQPERTSREDALTLWYELGRRYSNVEGNGNRSTMLGFTVTCVTGALVLLSGFFFSTEWAGATPEAALGAATVPIVAGLFSGGGLFLWERARVLRQAGILREALAEKGEDVGRPARDGLHAYYDAQLILLRSEYEFLRLRDSKTARLFEESFGFTPEDGFETGPLNVSPDTDGMQLLRERWERRISSRKNLALEPPELGLREDLAYRVFPREMTVPMELATRAAYLEISCNLLRKRYGRDPEKRAFSMPKELRRRMERDLGERAALTRKVRRSGPEAG